jgi:hypothetical protein
MSAGLTQQLAGYGDVFAAEVDALARETIMTTDQAVIPIDRDENDKKKSPWRRVGALVGAAAVIIGSIVGLTVLRSDSDAVASPPFVTAEDAARAKENAVEVGDWEAFRAAYADEGVDSYYTDDRPFSVNEEKAEARFTYQVALGARPVVESCSVSSKDGATCTVVTTNGLTEALGAEAIVETQEYRTSDGLLAFVGQPTDWVTPPIVIAFWDWLRETNHPAFAADVEFSRRPVIKDAPVVAAAILEATDEFLAQYNG